MPFKRVSANLSLFMSLNSLLGFNMENSVARFLAYATFLVDGNVITNEMSIGSKTTATGPDPPAPGTVVGGLDTHAVFEGVYIIFNLLN